MGITVTNPPGGYTWGTEEDDTFIVTNGIDTWRQLEGGGGFDRLVIERGFENGSWVTIADHFDTGQFSGRVTDTSTYAPFVGFSEMEDISILGSPGNDIFELLIKPASSVLLVDLDAGAGADSLSFNFSTYTQSVSFVVGASGISSSYGQFAGFETFTLYAGAGNDELRMGDGNDNIRGGAGTNFLEGGGGNDSIHSSSLTDWSDGGAGNDHWSSGVSTAEALTVEIGEDVRVNGSTIAVNFESVSFGSGSGNDLITLRGVMSTSIDGGNGSDTLTYRDSADIGRAFSVSGEGGALFGSVSQTTIPGSYTSFQWFEKVNLFGNGQNDSFSLRGIFSPGSIMFDAGGGSDELVADFRDLAGATVFIVHGDGTIENNRGQFVAFERFSIIGGNGADTIAGWLGNDSISGGEGNDYLYGGGGVDLISGEAGFDVIDGGADADLLNGGGGDDLIFVTAGDRIFEQNGDGFDNVLARESYVLNADGYVEVLSTDNHGGTQSIDLTGNNRNNVVIGNAGSNILDGGGGADRLAGLGGDDYLIVDSMDDFVDETAGGGYDNLLCRADYVLTTDAEIEVISTDNHSGTAGIDIRGSSFGQVIIGNAGSNILDGGGGADRLAGLGGNDFLIVDSMDDYVDETAGGGYDNLICRNSYVLTGSAEIEVISTDNHGGAAAIDITGSAFGQVIIGNAGSNILIGGGGSDRLAGLGGNDFLVVDSMDDFVDEEVGGGFDNLICRTSYTLFGASEIELMSTDNHSGTAAINLTGSAYNQVIIGNAGDNILDGSFGQDWLDGLGGADSFAFTTNLSNFNIDTIAGFGADDTIHLDDATFAGLALGALNPNAFVNGTAAADADDRIVYDAATGRLFFDADGNGAGNMLHFATLENHFALTASDFTVI